MTNCYEEYLRTKQNKQHTFIGRIEEQQGEEFEYCYWFCAILQKRERGKADLSKNKPQIRVDEFEALEKSFYAQPKDPYNSFRQLAEFTEAMELANNKFVIHLCLRRKSNGFLLRSFKIADLILKEPETDYPRYKALSHFITYICAYYEELVRFLNNVKGEEMESIFHKWYHQQIITDETDDRWLGEPQTKINGVIKKLEEQLEMFHYLREGDVFIIFAIDEAQSLTVPNERLGSNSLYHYFRIASATIPGYDLNMKVNTFVLLLNTVLKIANFLLPSVFDPSFRYVTKSTNLYLPYWTIDLWDVLSTFPNAHLIINVHQRKERTLDLLNDEAQCTAVFKAVTSAKCKLMGGYVRASLLVKPQEPLVAEAAARIINHHKIKFKETIEPLLGFIRERIVELGLKGELTVHILLTLAWDHANHQVQKHLPEFIYTYPLMVRQYLTALMSDVSYLKGQINSDSIELLLSGIVFFTHFIVVAQQSAIDHDIPVLLLNGKFTCILIQTCNYSESNPNIMFASLVIIPQTAGLDMNLDWPYLILYFTLGYKNGMIKNLKVVHDTTSDKAKKIKRQEMLSKSLANEDAEVAKSD
ncbi:2923_t:CDS:2 [Funneliformis mosseae]|uniref:2923_t:CDS:1 n=1 Tax=Funneliformis mosseae TaxID=27381 RepID=A0A9N9ED41_FUNMO|nr:2923_t:CDS:2 [Funneliformis mosseae]